MLGFLSPIVWWLGGLLAVPLIIHFLGRQKLRRQRFPSLLLVRERMSKSMQRHRLKNLLLLLIRTLLILCLLLALWNPVLRSPILTGPTPDHSIALIHNGIYGRLSGNDFGAQSRPMTADRNALATQWERLRTMDSAGRLHLEYRLVIPDGAGPGIPSERFGDFRGALRKALAEFGGQDGTVQLVAPVFSWSELAEALPELQSALQSKPGMNLTLLDYSGRQEFLSAFQSVRGASDPNSPVLKLTASSLSSSSSSGTAQSGKVKVILRGRHLPDVQLDRGNLEVTLPMSEVGQATGSLSFSESGFAAADYFFCYPEPGLRLVEHSGSQLSSWPSLGRGGFFRRIAHVASADAVDWNAGRGKKLGLVFLANGSHASQGDYQQAMKYVKEGGRLILSVGRETDIPLLNRNLLEPLRVGRLGGLTELPETMPAELHHNSGNQSTSLPQDLGDLGGARKFFKFAPDSGTEVILALKENAIGNRLEAADHPALLVARDCQKGKLYLWTTDVDDLDWSDVGVHPALPLLHQAFQEYASSARDRNQSVAADSIYTWTSDERDDKQSARAEIHVFDPENRPFTRLRLDGERLRLGPFDKLGIYRILSEGDTACFAVNLLSDDLETDMQSSPEGSTATTKKLESDKRSATLKALASFAGRVSIVPAKQSVIIPASARPLWPIFYMAAILLLFLEGLTASAFSMRLSRS